MGSSRFARRLAGIFAGNMVNNAIAFGITVLAARLLAPAEFGVLTLAVAATLLLGLLLDLGQGPVLVRTWGHEPDPARRRRFAATILNAKWLAFGLVAAYAYGLAKLAGLVWPGLSAYGALTGMALLSAALVGVWTSCRAIEQARGNFRSFGAYTALYGLFRLVALGGVLLSGQASLPLLFGTLYLFPLLLLAPLGSLSIYRSLGSDWKAVEPSLLRRAAAYGAWVAFGGFAFSVLPRLPQLVLAQRGLGVEVGIYGAGVTFLMIFSLLNDSLRAILFPTLSALEGAAARQAFRRRLRRASMPYWLTAVLVIALLAALQGFLLGPAYQASLPVFCVLAVSSAGVLYLGLGNALVHSLGRPETSALVDWGRCLVLMIFLLFAESALEAACGVAVIMLAGELALSAWLVKQDRLQHVGKEAT